MDFECDVAADSGLQHPGNAVGGPADTDSSDSVFGIGTDANGMGISQRYM